MSSSDFLRSKGNVLYRQVSQGNFCPVVKRAKLCRAQQFYNQAFHESVTEDEHASCCKNLGLINWLWCKTELQSGLAELPSSSEHMPRCMKLLIFCKQYILKSVERLLQAKEHGQRASKPQCWLDNIDSVLLSMVEWATLGSTYIPGASMHAPLLQYLCEALENASVSKCRKPEAFAFAYKSYADALFKQAVLKVTETPTWNDFKESLSLLLNCYRPLQCAESAIARVHATRVSLSDLEELHQSVYVHQRICEAMQAVHIGDEALEKALKEEEELNTEGVKDALDHYRTAALCTRELDMETEALAMSRIGKVYSDVLMVREKAHEYHFQAVRLALTVMSPRIGRADWYIYSSKKVKKHQECIENQKNEEHQKPISKNLSKKVSDLQREAGKDAESFLKFIYNTYPHPEWKRMVLPVFGSSMKVKASLKKAICQYHPDANGQFGEDWKVLCGEITEHLTFKYECFKG